GRGVAFAQQLQGKELSFNNLVDLQAGWNLAEEFDQPTTVIIKHTNPCGAASAENLAESYRKALEADPVSAFGSVIAFNRPLDLETAEETAKLFVEAVIAPGYEAAANERLSKKKNLRLMIMDRLKEEAGSEVLELKNLGDGLLVQTQDRKLNHPDPWRTVTARQPSPEEQEALLFAWRVAKHVKSNAIVFVRQSRTVGVGAGQMSRVDAAQIAIRKAKELKHSLAGTVVGSDAFLPFPDGVRVAGEAGATAVIQPGGSVRDEEVIEAANHLGLAMVFTGIRHFRH
ncbi:MAG: bifunctional phosphoribosylaminoimidazolecarboxamide formyltransferase/IMP cyclohydrolase, partial [Acidobacteria bacterium]|nr:bifunctional phosphoribosylaminoimidazolecarboxamide formyltransferase/IMP cyclohydrolase [Acidobacteriota bacterium]